MKKISFLLFFWPALCLAVEDNCASNSRALLSPQDFAYIAGDYIDEGKIVYSPITQKHMDQERISGSDIEYTLRYPAKILPRNLNQHTIIGSPNRDGSQLRLLVSLDVQGERQLIVNTVKLLLPEDQIPPSKADFVSFISDFIDRRALIYPTHVRRRMNEKKISASDIEYVFRNPTKVGNKTTQNYAPGDTVYIRGESADKILYIGITLMEKGRIGIISIRRILDDQIPLEREDFMRFMNNYIGAGKKIIYTRLARDRMDDLAFTEDDVQHILKYPIETERKTGRNGYQVMGQTANRVGLQLVISFNDDKQIIVVAVDTPLSHKMAVTGE